MRAQEPERWHLKREIQLGHLISTMVISISAVVYIGDIKRDVEILKAQKLAQHELDERQDKSVTQMGDLLRAQLERIDAKLDRLIEKPKR